MRDPGSRNFLPAEQQFNHRRSDAMTDSLSMAQSTGYGYHHMPVALRHRHRGIGLEWNLSFFVLDDKI